MFSYYEAYNQELEPTLENSEWVILPYYENTLESVGHFEAVYK